MQKIAISVLVAISLFFIACDDKDSKEAKEYEIQKALDSGNFEKVLKMTANCNADEKCQMDRAAAYAGRAGFTVADVIVALSDDENNEKFYEILGKKATNTADADLNNSKSAYEAIIAKAGNKSDVCKKGTADYKKASYYQQASCFPHGMVVMAKSATLMSSISEKYKNTTTGDVNINDTASDTDLGVIAGLINDDLDTIINLFGADNADTVQEIDKIKTEICGSPSCLVSVANLKTYLNTL